ncbi:MAG TPA: ATP-dependent zinc metalloprotease FtsH [Sumerlaeia bacterium]|nr:ATP-dependent zinc metalloprotease FtsH [Sumerlaeia bacterium]
MSGNLRNLVLWIAIFVAFIFMAKKLTEKDRSIKLDLSAVMEMGREGLAGANEPNRIVAKIEDRGGALRGAFVEPYGDPQGGDVKYKTFQSEYIAVGSMPEYVVNWALKNNIPYKANQSSQLLSSILFSFLFPILLIVVIWVFLMRQFQAGSNKAMSFGKSRAKLVTEGQVKISFEDVAGIDEVKEELNEIIQFLKDPQKFSRLGGKIPKGVLLHGLPGTGKTLLARAVAGEASVPFFSISGSDFVEMFVGVGASRVRDLFEQGKKAKPCLIYIDEIDAVGRHRFAGIGGGHDEREQTLNQLLVELDGFAPNEGVIVMASTNRPDVLDPALLRPGRFDRQIRVDLPDMVGREKILQVHTREIKMADGVSLQQIARGTPSFSGADLANLANEAALLAARKDKNAVEMEDLEEAKDRVLMGPERRSLAMSEKELKNTAYHEAGHALVSKLTPDAEEKVHKVTIIPRGRTLGSTAILPEEDRHSQSRRQLFNALLYLMGGRAAEECKFNTFTTGAANDLHRATDLAHSMVCEFGMSERLGPRTFGSPSAQVFLGRDISRDRDYSEETASLIDTEVRELLSSAYHKALQVLRDNMDPLERISQALLERETLNGDELDVLIRGEELPPFRRGRNGETRAPSATEAASGKEERGKQDRPAAGAVLQPPTTQPS